MVLITKEHKDIKKSLRKIIDTFEEKLDFSKGFFLKPNIVFPVSEKSGQLTRHKIVKGLIEVLREKDSKVDILLAEGTAAGSNPEENFRISGYSQLASDLGVELLDLNKVEHTKVKWKYGTIQLPKLAFEKTYINLPILKASSAAGISGAMKNQKGLLKPNMKKGFHKLDLHDPIAQLNKTIQPDLTIMDGHNFFNKNILISGDNTYEIDTLAIKLLGAIEPDYMKISRDIGVGNDDFISLGDDTGDIRSSFKYRYKEYKKVFRIRLWSNPRACSMCRFLFHDINTFPPNNLRYTILMYLKLLKYAFTGVEIVFGSNPELKQKYKKVICIGDCTRKLAKEKGYTNIPGCPPTKEEMLKYF